MKFYFTTFILVNQLLAIQFNPILICIFKNEFNNIETIVIENPVDKIIK